MSITATVRTTEEQLKTIDAAAEVLQQTRSQFIAKAAYDAALSVLENPAEYSEAMCNEKENMTRNDMAALFRVVAKALESE